MRSRARFSKNASRAAGATRTGPAGVHLLRAARRTIAQGAAGRIMVALPAAHRRLAVVPHVADKGRRAGVLALLRLRQRRRRVPADALSAAAGAPGVLG